jgi:hypothetical protein
MSAGLVTLLTHVDFVKGASKQCINGKLVLPVSCCSHHVLNSVQQHVLHCHWLINQIAT